MKRLKSSLPTFLMAKNIRILENVPLAPLTTLKIGGSARFFARAENEEQVIEAFNFAAKKGLEIFVLGGGSNVLISDNGFDGIVLQIAIKGYEVEQCGPGTKIVKAGAGEDWDEFVEFCVDQDLQGIECLSGIPGFIGGTPVQNVGAYGQEVSETISQIRCFDRKTGTIVELVNSDCNFSYRASIFNTSARERYIVLAVKYVLRIGGKPKIVYADLQKYFCDRSPTLKETRKFVLEIRAAKSMVIDKDDPNSKSVGSFFKNPVVSNEDFELVKQKARDLELLDADTSLLSFRVDDKNVKIPAAWLIENSGFFKGYSKGNAGISTKHALAIINRGNALASEVLALKGEIQAKVEDRFGILLAPEPIFVGF